MIRKYLAISFFKPKYFHKNKKFFSSISKRTQKHACGKLLQNPPSETPLKYYKTIHARIIIMGFQQDTFLSNILINVYSKNDFFEYSCKVFDETEKRNLITWSSMILGYTKHGFYEKALMVFSEFRKSCDEVPNEFVLTSVVRACSKLVFGEKSGEQVHGLVVKMGFERNDYVGTSLVELYSKLNEVENARLVFDDIWVKSSVTWTIMMHGYARNGRSDVALCFFEEMSEIGIVPDRYVLSTVLVACLMLEFLCGGKQIHAYLLRSGQMDVSLTNSLIDLYLKCGSVEMGRKLFDRMTGRNVISWTTMISGYMQNSFDHEAVRLFTEMNSLGFKPDGFACTSVLTSCASLKDNALGKQVHAYVIKDNLEYDEFVRNGLIDMYSKCDLLTDARRAFDSMSYLSAIPYNTIIEGYSRQEKLHEVLDLFNEMRLRSLAPNLLTFVCLFGLSASLLAIKLSNQLHGMVTKVGISLEKYAGSALIDVYSKCGFVKEARLVFDEMDDRDIVVWNAMLFGYTLQSENEEALKLFLELQLSVQKASAYTFVSLLTAASNLASLVHGKQFHNHIIKLGLDFNPYVINAVLDMYAKCGSVEEARIVFDSTSCRDVVCWNSIIVTYAQHGEAEEALKLFEEMIEMGIDPNYVTFIAVLSACSHVGLLDNGCRYFDSMPSFGIVAGTEHYACMVSLFGRAGKLFKAKEIIDKMPIEPEAIIWRSLLNACRTSGNVELGKYAAEMAILSDPKDSGSYVSLSNILASKGMWSDVKDIRNRMDRSGVVKEAGCSWVELNNEAHAFIARDKSHPKGELIWEALGNLFQHMKDIGYNSDTTEALMNYC